MATVVQQFAGLRCPGMSSNVLTRQANQNQKKVSRHSIKAATTTSVAIKNAKTKERLRMKELLQEASERCRTSPMEGVAFSVEDFHSAIEKYHFDSEIGAKVGTFFLLTSLCLAFFLDS